MFGLEDLPRLKKTLCMGLRDPASAGASLYQRKWGRKISGECENMNVSSGTTGRCPPDQMERLKLRGNNNSPFQNLPIREKKA